MRLVRFTGKDGDRYGILRGESIRPIPAETLEDALQTTGSEAPEIALADVELLAPVERPRKILGIGVNYAAHAAESVSFIDTKAPQVQKWFNKQATSANAPFGKVHLPKVSEQLDYEVELVVVIGKHGRHVPRERAMEIVGGFCVGCDYSVRDWQKASQTMIMGKGFDTHAPFGPAIVTPDEIEDVSSLQLRSYINGELRQSGHVRDMIHDIPAQIAHLTAAFTLEPGDLIFTGTPAGVGAGHTPPKWLKAGDTVRLEIDQIGVIENQIIAEPETARIG
ncbi:fumarylacetoacetate hydrolase family protein [Hyphomonas atlantica]|uniref:fumarylacetoacetate hydrolase family protein n=1 Tax=Hyphomonas atlantica TaxID=1280948 RepID=UPI0032B2AC55